MSKEEKISLEKLKNMAYDINCIGAEYCKIDEEDMTCNKCLRCAYDTISNYIDKLQKENEKLKNYEYIKALIQQANDLKERINKLQIENEKLKQEIKDITSIPEGDESYE